MALWLMWCFDVFLKPGFYNDREMKYGIRLVGYIVIVLMLGGCWETRKEVPDKAAKDILGNPEYRAFSYGGYRHKTRDTVPTVAELKDDMRLLSAMGTKLLRTYNTQQYGEAANLLKAIKELQEEDPSFEMYVMLGAWIECEAAWTRYPNHAAENIENNTAEIEAAIALANSYPGIVKMIAVGNEAMVQWAGNYFVVPKIILNWVNHLQAFKKSGGLPADILITSSDNYESWGGGDKSYHSKDLENLLLAVDFVSLHTSPFHDTYYDPQFWGVPEKEENLSDVQKLEAAMLRAVEHAKSQYQSCADYITSLGIDKPIHIGETGWAGKASTFYGNTGSRAADEYKMKLYYEHIRSWTDAAGISCFYFEAFDEQWKDPSNVKGSENHFGLINQNGEAKYALWKEVDQGVFNGLTRNGLPITKTYNGDASALMTEVLLPPLASEMGVLEITTVNDFYQTGDRIKEDNYVIIHESWSPNDAPNATFPSSKIKLNSWEGSCEIRMNKEGIIEIDTGIGYWWGCALELKTVGRGENLSNFKDGTLNFEIMGTTKSSFKLGFQTGAFSQGNLVNNYITFGQDDTYRLAEEWTKFAVPISKLVEKDAMTNVTALLFFRGDHDFDGKKIFIKNIFYSR